MSAYSRQFPGHDEQPDDCPFDLWEEHRLQERHRSYLYDQACRDLAPDAFDLLHRINNLPAGTLPSDLASAVLDILADAADSIGDGE